MTSFVGDLQKDAMCPMVVFHIPYQCRKDSDAKMTKKASKRVQNCPPPAHAQAYNMEMRERIYKLHSIILLQMNIL